MIGFDRFHGASVRRAVEAAALRLGTAECQKIFTDFHDEDGTPLQHRLDTEAVAAADYLRRIVFTDGSDRRRCASDHTLAFTAPGSRVVYVCVRRFYQVQIREAMTVEMILIHELLHTLGLRENPPNSYEITRQVAGRCHGIRVRPDRPAGRALWELRRCAGQKSLRSPFAWCGRMLGIRTTKGPTYLPCPLGLPERSLASTTLMGTRVRCARAGSATPVPPQAIRGGPDGQPLTPNSLC